MLEAADQQSLACAAGWLLSCGAQASSLLPGQCSAQTPALAMGRRRH